MKAKTAKAVGKFLVRTIERVFIEESVKDELAKLAELFEDGQLSIEIGMEEGECERNAGNEEDSDWCGEIADVLEDRLDQIRRQMELKKFEQYENIVGL